MITLLKKSYGHLRHHIKKQRYYFANKGLSSRGYGFSSSHVWMWELNHKESWVLKNWCFWTVVLEKTLESPLDCKEIQPVHPKGEQSWVFIGRTDVEAETPILWPPHVKSWLIGKDPNAGKDWRQREKRVAEDKMAGDHHWFNEHQLGQTPGNSEGQGGLTYCSPQGCKELDPIQWLNNNKMNSETYYNQTFKRQTEKHWSIKREAKDHIHGILNKISSRLLMGNFGGQKQWTGIFNILK